jgi:hypothetical protein
MANFVPRFPNAPLQYDYTNEAQFRSQIRQSISDLSSGFGLSIDGLPAGTSGDVLVYNSGTALWTPGQTFTGTYDFSNAAQFDSNISVDGWGIFTNKLGVGGDGLPNNSTGYPLQIMGAFSSEDAWAMVDATSGNVENAIYQSGTDPDIWATIRQYQSVATLWQVRSKAGDPTADDREATLALIRSDDGSNEEFVDLYNNGYHSSGSKIAVAYGMRIQKRGTGSYRDFYWDYYDGTTDTDFFVARSPDYSEGARLDLYVRMRLGSSMYGWLSADVAGDLDLVQGAYYNGGWLYSTTTGAARITLQANGITYFYRAAAGSVDASVTWDTQLYLDSTNAQLYSQLTLYPPTGEHSIVFFYTDQTYNNAWIGIPAWDTDGLYIYAPNAANTSHELAWYYSQQTQYWYTAGSQRMYLTTSHLHLYDIPLRTGTADGYYGDLGHSGWSGTSYWTSNLYYGGSGDPAAAGSWRYTGAAGAYSTSGGLVNMYVNGGSASWSFLYAPTSTGADATPASLTQLFSISSSSVTAYTLLGAYASSDEQLRLQHTSGTGNPFLSFYQAGTRRAYIQYADSGDSFAFVNETSGGYIYLVPSSGYVWIQSASDLLLKLDHGSSTGNPYISWQQNGTRRAYVQYEDSTDRFIVVNEYGTVQIWPGYSGTETPIAVFGATGSGYGESYIQNTGMYWVPEDQTGDTSIDWRYGNIFHWDFTGTVTFTLASTPPDGYICHIFLNYSSSSGSVGFSGFGIRWNGATGPGTFGSSGTTLWITLIWQDGICVGDWGTYS